MPYFHPDTGLPLTTKYGMADATLGCPLLLKWGLFTFLFLVLAYTFSERGNTYASSDEKTISSDAEACQKQLLPNLFPIVKEKLSKLPPAAIDIPSVSQGVLQFGKDLNELTPHFKELETLEQALIGGNVSAEKIKNEANHFLEKISAEVDPILDSHSSSSSRKLIEGYRMLLARSEALMRRANYLEEKPPGKEKNQSDQPNKPSTNNTKQEGDGEQKQQPIEFQPLKPSSENKDNEAEKVKKDLDKSNRGQDQNFEKNKSALEEKKLELTLDPNEEQSQIVLKKYLNRLWAHSLRQVQSSTKLLDAISEYMRLCQTLSSQYPTTVFLSQYAARAQSTFETLDGTKIRYSTLEEFAIKLVSQGTGASGKELSQIKVFLEYLNKIYFELKSVSSLTNEEQVVANQVQALLLKLTSDDTVNPDDASLSQAFLRQLVGPLARTAIKSEFPDGNGGVNESKIAKEIKNNALTNFLVMARLKPYLRISSNHTTRPAFEQQFIGARTPIHDFNYNLEPAEDVQNRMNFHRDGPLKFDYKRVVSEDMLEKVYREPVDTTRLGLTKPKNVRIILIDVSGSMFEKNKDVIEANLLAASLDESQTKVAENKADCIVYSIAFGETTGTPEKIENIKQAQDYFNLLRKTPLSSLSGTSLTNALVKAYNLIKDAQATGGDLKRADILLITDGEDPSFSIDTVIKKRKELDVNIKIAFNAITIGEKNSKLEALASKNEQASKFGRYSYQHISYEEISEILDVTTRLNQLQIQAGYAQVSGKKDIKNHDLVKLKQSITHLSSKSDRNIEVSNREKTMLFQKLNYETKNGNLQNSYAIARQSEQLFSPLFLALDSNLARDWSQDRKIHLFDEYLSDLAKELHTTGDEILAHIGQITRKKIMQKLKVESKEINK